MSLLFLICSGTSLKRDSICHSHCMPSCFSASARTALAHAPLTVKCSHIPRKFFSMPNTFQPRNAFCSIISLHCAAFISSFCFSTSKDGDSAFISEAQDRLAVLATSPFAASFSLSLLPFFAYLLSLHSISRLCFFPSDSISSLDKGSSNSLIS